MVPLLSPRFEDCNKVYAADEMKWVDLICSFG